MKEILVDLNTGNVHISGSIDSNLAGIFSECGVYINGNCWHIEDNNIPKLLNNSVDYDIKLSGNVVSRKVNYKLKTDCYPHQIDGIDFGMSHDKFILGDEQGLGKTKQCIDIAVNSKPNGLKRCLIICGINGNKYNWVEEIGIHSDEKSWVLGTRFRKNEKSYEGTSKDKLNDLSNLPEDVFFIVTNIETLRGLSENVGTKKRRRFVFPIADKINQLCEENEIGMIVFDECQMAKNPDSQTGKSLLCISANKMIAASGTPLMNNPLEAYVPLKWLGYESHSFYDFKKHYCIMGGFHNTEIRGYKNLGELRNWFNTIMLRRLKSEVLDLPPKVYTQEYVEMEKDQSKLYDDVLAHIKEDIDLIKLSPSPLAQMIRLRQTTGYPGILSTTIKTSAKLLRMQSLVREVVDSGGKVVIFSQWVEVIIPAMELLKEFNPLEITGRIELDQRIANKDTFQTDSEHSVICGTIGAMGTGYTLNAANTVIFLDEPWNRALKDQAEDRAHRIGTKGTVSIITLITKNTIDERINSLVSGKGKMVDMLVDGKSVDRGLLVDYLLS